MHRLTEHHTGSLTLQGHLKEGTLYILKTVKRLTQRVNHAAQHVLTYIYGGNAACTVHGHVLLDLIGRTQQDGTYVILLQIHHYGLDAIVKLYQLIGLGILESVNADHAVTHLEHGSNLLETGAGVNAL